jgi:hypothetical protein
MSREYEDLFKKLKDLTNVAIDQIMTNENNTIEDLEAGKTMLWNVSHSIQEALEQGVEGSNVMRSAIDSIISEKYLEDTGQELDFNSEDRPDVILAWLEPKGSDYKYKIKEEAVKKLQKTALKIDFLIKKADEGIAAMKQGKEEMWNAIKKIIGTKIEPVLKDKQAKMADKQAKMAQDDFNKLLEEMKEEKKDDGTLLFYKKLAGYGNRDEFKSNISFKEAEGRGGRRTRKRKRRRRRRSRKKKRRKRNLKKRTKRRRRSKRRRRR